VEQHSLELYKAALNRDRLPRHVAIIMDGNGRWAVKRKLPRISGHRAGIDTVRRIVRTAGELGIEYLTLYTFSSENWGRPENEVKGLMKLLAETLKREFAELHRSGVRIMTIGDSAHLPANIREAFREAWEMTTHNTGLTLILALNYGGRDEIVRAVRSIARDIESGEIGADDISPALFERHLDTQGIPDPDLLIRTADEHRLSNFLLWQLAYTEFWITEVTWPDFSEFDFCKALESFSNRERRFGKTSQQLTGADNAASKRNGS
jgi:undecaprenyl diphosphate synthase